MLAGAVDSLTDGVTTTWLRLIQAPSVVFWSIGVLAWWWAHRDIDVLAWMDRRTGAEQVVLVVAVAAVLVASSALLSQLSRPMIRLLEGYWPRRLDRFRRARLAQAIERRRDLTGEWKTMERTAAARSIPKAGPTPREAAAWIENDRRRSQLDQLLHLVPVDEAKMMPTQLGNILRASETYASERYGLDAIVTWPRLWLLMPESTRQELIARRGSLDRAVAMLAALVVSIIWLAFTWWVIPIVLLGPALVYATFVLPRAQVFGECVEAAFDIHRGLLYRELRLALPTDPAEEARVGEQLTRYLWRGFLPAHLTFVDPELD